MNIKRFLCFVLLTTLVAAQVARVNRNQTFTGHQTFTGGLIASLSTQTHPCRDGVGAPTGQNGVNGDCYYQTDGAAGARLWWATTTGAPATWTLQVGGNSVIPDATLTSGLPIIGAGTTHITVGTRSGNTTAYGTVSGSQTPGKCLEWDANGNIVTAVSNAACSAGGTSTWQTGGSTTATESTANFVAGSGISLTGSNPSGKYQLTVAVEPATALLRSTNQAGTSTYCRSTTGNDTYTCALTPTLTAYTTGGCLVLNPDTVNTGVATVNVDTLGAKSILNRAAGALSNGDITANTPISVCYDGTQFIIQGDGSASGTLTSASFDWLFNGCDFGGAGTQTLWSVPTTNPATPACNGSNLSILSNVSFINTVDQLLMKTFRWPTNLNTGGAVSLKLLGYQVSGGSGNVKFTAAIACIAAGADYTAAITYNTASNTGTVAVTTSNLLQDLTISSISISGCSANSQAVLKLTRDTSVGSNYANPYLVAMNAQLNFSIQ